MMTPSYIVRCTCALFNRIEKPRGGWKGGAHSAKMVIERGVVDSEHVRLTTIVLSSDT